MLSVELWNAWSDGSSGVATALGVMMILVLAVFSMIGRSLVMRFSRQQSAGARTAPGVPGTSG